MADAATAACIAIGSTAASVGPSLVTAVQQEAENRLRREEEEELSTHMLPPGEGGPEWEFKILRSKGGAFGNREKFRRALEEESAHGWVLFEKLDNTRLRLKRPAGTVDDEFAEVDPYRTEFGRLAAGIIVGIAIAVSIALSVGVLVLSQVLF